jgi:hypothetical protein
MEFDFISDEKFRSILIRDFEELNKCLEARAAKSVLILSGSIIESILTDYLLNFPTDQPENKSATSMDLKGLIDKAFEMKLISESTKDLSTVIKNFRNLIHPGREIRKNEKFDFDSAIVAKSLLNIVLKEIKEKYITNFGHKALDIISKLENDAISQTIFEKIISKIHKSEKVKLYNLLIEYNLKVDFIDSKLTNPKKYISILKSQVDKDVILKQLMKLIKQIEIGTKVEVIHYFYFLYDDISYLDESNKELILQYVLEVMTESTNNSIEFNNYYNLSLFNVFGKYLNNEQIKKEFLKLVYKIVINHTKQDYVYFSAYDQLINSLDTLQKDEINDLIIKNTNTYICDKFYKGYNNGDYLPF